LAMLYRIQIEADEDGQFVAVCPSLPGCVSPGHTGDEALANIKDAIVAYLASLEKHGDPIPPPITQ
jgi:antitoxin HicB